MTRRCFVLLGALALLLAMAGTGPALAASSRAGAARDTGVVRDTRAVHDTAATTAKPAAGEGPASGGRDSSPIVPLVFAGIVILAAAAPWAPPGSRYRLYRIERRW
jgi:hypothetical protein